MKAILICSQCSSEHHITESKIQGKKGKFRCKSCSFLNPFDRSEAGSQEAPAPSPKLVLFDLQFESEIPETELHGQWKGHFFDDFRSVWFDDRLLILPADENEIFQPKEYISITGLAHPKKLKGFRFDVRPDDRENQSRMVSVSDTFSANSGYRLSLTVESESETSVQGKIYLAIPDETNTYLNGTFKALRIQTVEFESNGTFSKELPSFVSNKLAAKVYTLSGNTLHLQESFSRLFEEEKRILLETLFEHWIIGEGEAESLVLTEENVIFKFSLSEKKMTESLIFLIGNQVYPDASSWDTIKNKLESFSDTNPSFVGILKKKFPTEMERLLEPPSSNPSGQDPSIAIQKDDPILLREILNSGVSPSYVSPESSLNPLSFSLLHEALSSAGAKCGQLLLDSGADPNHVDKNGETPLFRLCQNNEISLKDKTTLLDSLITLGINVDQQSLNGMTGLHWCSIFGEPSLAKRLIQGGANIHIADNFGNTSLHEACKFGHSSVLALLLEAGAMPNVFNQEHRCGRDLAFESLESAELQGNEEEVARYERILSLLDVYGG
ncbi:ankyrin repeat domain-containing protein [Leptospira idonii]|uniref:Uncharacterized protein n=1 Tax=Leptospira idonii TaxID=1193500 RepID=A0A4V3JXK1_9LEPT|nr:ankyrin repeat domain-containing protein [Leptospira idonii]TGN17328.1 hypothetical protein EHS15_17480 [Leptospira idonii]